MSNYRKLGDILNLELQLGDGAKFPTTRAFAQIDELDATPIVAEFELTKVADGSYTDAIQTMPVNSAVKVTYFIRKADGTSPETKYNPYYLTELFVRDFTAELINTNLDAKVSTARASEIITAIQPDEALTASLIDAILLAEVEPDTIITGVVDEC